jgi:diguanylate cyclase (GGDEF)-like protein
LQQIVTLLGAIVTVLVVAFLFLLYRRVKRINLQLREANSQLEFHAVRDPLTGLYNRRSFLDMMKTRMAQAEAERRDAQENNPDCLILLDIDYFKQINDGLGHAIGDAVLMEVAHRLRKAVRDTDMVLRWGGEEFLVFSPKSSPSQSAGLVERLLQAVGTEPVMAGDKEIQVTVTAGFISCHFLTYQSRFSAGKKYCRLPIWRCIWGRQMVVTVLTVFRVCWCRLRSRCLCWKRISRRRLRMAWWS